MGMYPKVFWKTEAETGNALRIKIEINTFDRSPALPLIHLITPKILLVHK
jgi:hypothetical protein